MFSTKQPESPHTDPNLAVNEVEPLRELERRAIARALKATNGNVAKAAKLLGIGRATLYRRLANPDMASLRPRRHHVPTATECVDTAQYPELAAAMNEVLGHDEDRR